MRVNLKVFALAMTLAGAADVVLAQYTALPPTWISGGVGPMSVEEYEPGRGAAVRKTIVKVYAPEKDKFLGGVRDKIAHFYVAENGTAGNAIKANVGKWAGKNDMSIEKLGPDPAGGYAIWLKKGIDLDDDKDDAVAAPGQPKRAGVDVALTDSDTVLRVIEALEANPGQFNLLQLEAAVKEKYSICADDFARVTSTLVNKKALRVDEAGKVWFATQFTK